MLRLLTTSTLRATGTRGFAGSALSRVKILGDHDAYKKITATGTGQKAIVYFTAKWCPPCKMISPIYDELSAKYQSIEFAKVDVDELAETTSRAGVRSMPTFYFFSDGELQRQLSFSGADENLLREHLQELSEL
ncbi:hypothetical protein Poli38472_002064 [Pythium oligandrum]|uniref:Thioredoxin domain-containing protein n=1 Tax=Pythium oligandrum TaxID=41045 RepID=A0A8K1CHK9_PYTOL|nr:hypothetical protein Poli38472_002064 [Pythium oligandrum]|eukprot:TMW63123.1 hypothetical protein Poli38472_002064 [Pythium oligandrum]